MIDEKYIEELLEFNDGSSLVALWLWARKYPKFNGDLGKAKEGLFFLAENLMHKGILRLANNENFLSGSIDDQLNMFRAAWPKEYDEKTEEKDIDNLWWYLFAPAGAVWIYSDGSEVWT
ncbi:DUF596 domain-containing protein [Variovorax sp. J22P240]|uniref:DUF596 domain-containing protein n=1 Tax=Variovorax sp. J22P240 TaxID=3053514 RepID=UPI002578CE0B|nr:DUF596 domain-containing protein [Variovorax sp. J22P240]MDL9998626.1 DUF596 domain-containing protein [Variovorax sp. J22P240]